MGKGFKGIAALGIIGGASIGAFKAFKQYEYLKETHNNVILFNGEKLIYEDVFEGDSVAAIAAGVEIDLRDAEFDSDYVSMDLYGVGAGFRITVPKGIRVVTEGINKASGLQIDVEDSEDGKILNINYDLTGSGLMITSV